MAKKEEQLPAMAVLTLGAEPYSTRCELDGAGQWRAASGVNVGGDELAAQLNRKREFWLQDFGAADVNIPTYLARCAAEWLTMATVEWVGLRGSAQTKRKKGHAY